LAVPRLGWDFYPLLRAAGFTSYLLKKMGAWAPPKFSRARFRRWALIGAAWRRNRIGLSFLTLRCGRRGQRYGRRQPGPHSHRMFNAKRTLDRQTSGASVDVPFEGKPQSCESIIEQRIDCCFLSARSPGRPDAKQLCSRFLSAGPPDYEHPGKLPRQISADDPN